MVRASFQQKKFYNIVIIIYFLNTPKYFKNIYHSLKRCFFYIRVIFFYKFAIYIKICKNFLFFDQKLILIIHLQKFKPYECIFSYEISN